MTSHGTVESRQQGGRRVAGCYHQEVASKAFVRRQADHETMAVDPGVDGPILNMAYRRARRIVSLMNGEFMANIAPHHGAADEGASRPIAAFRIIRKDAGDPAPIVKMPAIVRVE